MMTTRASLLLLGPLMLVLGIFAACVPPEKAAPPVVAISGASSETSSQLEQGRQIYLNACSECHWTRNITSYSREDWPQILEEMTDRARLSPEEDDAVTAYVFAVLDSAGM